MTFLPTSRTEVRRLPQRGVYDRHEIDAILAEAFVCHVGFTSGDGKPIVIPTSFGRIGDTLYLHGSPASRMLRTLKDGVDVCVTVTLVDGLVLARSAFHHSINYRSVVVFGRAHEVTDPDEKTRALDAFVDHILPGRAAEARPGSAKEVRATLVLALPLDEASAKVRRGMPIDDEEDLALPVWAGVLPLTTTAAAPQADEYVPADLAVPGYISEYQRPEARGARR